MSAEAIATIAAAVVALTQLAKWGGIPDHSGPLAVLVLSALGVMLWGYSTEPAFGRNLAFSYFSAWIVVATSAAGVYGFTRAAGAAVTSATRMPDPPAELVTQRMLTTMAGELHDLKNVVNQRADPPIFTVQDPSPPRAGTGPRMPRG